jgi:hypothetical protein
MSTAWAVGVRVQILTLPGPTPMVCFKGWVPIARNRNFRPSQRSDKLVQPWISRDRPPVVWRWDKEYNGAEPQVPTNVAIIIGRRR